MWIIAALYLACALFAFGTTFAYFQSQYHASAPIFRREDYGIATFIALLGPIGAGIALLGSGFMKHGWRLR